MSRNNPDRPLARFTVEIPLEMKKRLEAAAQHEDRTATVIVRRALEAYLSASEAEHAVD